MNDSTNQKAIQHTPGPWVYKTAGRIRDAKGNLIASVNTIGNARLIAAAPNLLAACKDAAQAISGFWGQDPLRLADDAVYQQCLTAIRKAENGAA